MLVFFGFSEHQEKFILGLGNKLTLTRKTDNAVLIKVNTTKIGKTETNST